MGGFILMTAGLLGVQLAVRHTAAEPYAARAMVLSWIGAGLTLPYYGAETFGLQVIAQRSLDDGNPALLDLADEFRLGAVPATMFATGLGLLGLGAVLAAVAIWRAGVIKRPSGMPFAAGFALLLPQFFTPQPVRIGHGILVAAGCLWVAAELWRTSRAS